MIIGMIEITAKTNKLFLKPIIDIPEMKNAETQKIITDSILLYVFGRSRANAILLQIKHITRIDATLVSRILIIYDAINLSVFIIFFIKKSPTIH